VIREFRDEDAAQAVAVLRRLDLFPVTRDSLLQNAARVPPRAGRRAWIGDSGYAFARRLWELQTEGVGTLWFGVAPERRRQGLGTALLGAALGHLESLGVARVQAWAADPGAEFLERRGWQRARERVLSTLERAPAAIAPPTGVELVPLSSVAPPELYELDKVCSADEPGDTIDFGSLESYRQNELERPLLDLECSLAAVADGRPVSMSLVFLHGAAGYNGFTCTHPDWRGRGLATLVKAAVLRRAFERGVERVATTNDAENPAMLRVNERLGYAPLRTEVQLALALRERTSGAPSIQSTTLTEQ
jgi:GNAT superfamily N-acetyltransferase